MYEPSQTVFGTFKVSVNNPNINITYFSSLETAAEYALNTSDKPVAYIAMNVEKIMNLRRQPDLFIDVQNPLFYPDGAPMLWFADRKAPRIPGVEVWIKILNRLNVSGGRALVIGASDDVSRLSAEKLRANFPDVHFSCVDGFQSLESYCKLIASVRPDAVFVAMGSPRQEQVIAKLQTVWSQAFYMGIGGSLDIYSGKVKRAPKIFILLNVEFLYRLLLNPKRIIRQKVYFAFIIAYISGRLGVAAG
jgi:UDP-N-acetyl-D-mannosaminouronate:lipid I N-acetyl-D-mannosaminouronosyltransferase